jgi:hypothetical protein
VTGGDDVTGDGGVDGGGDVTGGDVTDGGDDVTAGGGVVGWDREVAGADVTAGCDVTTGGGRFQRSRFRKMPLVWSCEYRIPVIRSITSSTCASVHFLVENPFARGPFFSACATSASC